MSVSREAEPVVLVEVIVVRFVLAYMYFCGAQGANNKREQAGSCFFADENRQSSRVEQVLESFEDLSRTSPRNFVVLCQKR